MKTPKKQRNYINNKDLLEALKALRANPNDARNSRYVGLCILQINENLGKRSNFSRYSYLQEMKDDGVEACVYATPRFNPDKYSNPFGYFSKVAWRAFIKRIALEKEQNAIKHKYFAETYSEFGSKPNELSHAVVQEYEAKLAERKKKEKEKGLLKLLAAEKAKAEEAKNNPSANVA